MWCLRPLSVLLLLSTVPTGSEVVRSMSDCSDFLLHNSPPNIPGILEDGNILDQNRYKPICQTYENMRRFVTLYDTKNKIPVFSAYKYRGDGGSKPNIHWKIEPQVGLSLSDDKDYKNKEKLARGHLFPHNHALNETDKRSTNTLTNIVPQAEQFNSGSWSNMENCVKCVMDKYCKDNNGVPEGFVVTGQQPGNNKLNNKVNIPKMLWSAFCCYSGEKKKWLASAHWGDNVPDGFKPKYLQTRTLAELQNLDSGHFTKTKKPNKSLMSSTW
uniref:Uncharacterized protein n=1 Tax=Mastacembelus armatus TaxID=205130 RepID=A0A7N8YQD5_9TELE